MCLSRPDRKADGLECLGQLEGCEVNCVLAKFAWIYTLVQQPGCAERPVEGLKLTRAVSTGRLRERNSIDVA
jgi:hypothetical protein